MKPHHVVLILCIFVSTLFVIGVFIGRGVHWHGGAEKGMRPTWVDGVQNDIHTLIHYMTVGEGKGIGYQWLANVSDTFGNRVLGSKRLEDAIDSVVEGVKGQGFDNVHTESVPDLPLWMRGVENATLLLPRNYHMAILGVGGTVATPLSGITAEAVVVRSFAELRALGESVVSGKIVVYNQPWVDYSTSVAFRSGANEAAKYGALAVLIRSVASFSVYSPHTGMASYSNPNLKIPAACLTVEDAELLWRMQRRGQKLKIFLKILSQTIGTTTSRNTVFEIAGSEHPEEVVVLSGHLDSWDVGEGAMDDGGGVGVAWQALTSIKALGLKPKRTIRVILWVAEEFGHLGCAYYYKTHKSWTNETFVFVSESDMGIFRPTSPHTSHFLYRGSGRLFQSLDQISGVIRSEGIPISIRKDPGDLGDVEPWARDGVPGFTYLNQEKYDHYFIFHHTNADMMTVLTPEDFDFTSASFAAFALSIANMDQVHFESPHQSKTVISKK